MVESEAYFNKLDSFIRKCIKKYDVGGYKAVIGGEAEQKAFTYNSTLIDLKYDKLYSRNFSDIVITPDDPRHEKFPYEEENPGDFAPIEDLLFPQIQEVLRKEREMERLIN